MVNIFTKIKFMVKIMIDQGVYMPGSGDGDDKGGNKPPIKSEKVHKGN